MVRRLLCLSLFLLCSSAACTAAAAGKQLALIAGSGDDKGVKVRSLQVHTRLQGRLATTTIDVELANPHTRVLEAELDFPLAAGQQVDGFALDFNGTLRDAVPVAKARGRQVFEAIARRGVDPALLEQSAANHFHLRVFPVPAGGSRRVQLRLLQSLTPANGAVMWQQPMDWGPVQSFNLRIDSDDSTTLPSGTFMTRALPFVRTPGGWTARLDTTNTTLAGPARVTRPEAATAGAFGGSGYFYIEIPVARVAPRVLPRQLVVLWDSSGSGAERDHAAELALIGAWLNKAGDARVRLIRLRDTAAMPEDFDVRAGNWQALRTALLATHYDGASQAGGWQPVAGAADYLLFSDGHFNWGTEHVPTLAPGQRLYTVTSSASADEERLGAMARLNGGQLVRAGAAQGEAALQALLYPAATAVAAQGSGIGALEIDPAAPAGWLRAAGRLAAARTTVALDIRQADGTVKHLSLPLRVAPANGALASRLWARYRIATLQAEPETNSARIRDLGLQFGLPTGESSLIVLERAEDYVEYGITPPEDLRAQATELQEALRRRELKGRSDHLEQIVQRFEDKVRWWETDFSFRQQPQKGLQEAPDSSRDVAASVSMAEMAVPARAAAPAPAAPMARRASGMSADAANKSVSEAPIDSRLGISVQRVASNEPYMRRLEPVPTPQVYAAYLRERSQYARSPAFYLDAADLLHRRGQTALAVRVLSNLAELDLDNVAALRMLAYRLREMGQDALAVAPLRKVKRLAPHEPQSWRDLGLTLAAVGHEQEGINELAEVVNREWDGRFADIELIALAELNAIVARAKKRLDVSMIDRRLRRNLPLDLRAVLSWDANDTDIDLWVTDPSGERCYYGHRLTAQGGQMSNDFTGGYGPEEFSLKRAMPGVYRVEVNYFGSHRALLSNSTTLQLTLSTHFGTPAQRNRTVTLRLKQAQSTALVGEFTVDGQP